MQMMEYNCMFVKVILATQKLNDNLLCAAVKDVMVQVYLIMQSLIHTVDIKKQQPSGRHI